MPRHAHGIREPALLPGESVLPPTVPAGPLGAVATLAVLAAIAATVGLHAPGWLAGTGYALGGCLVLTVALRRADAPMGPADWVTLTRAVLVGAVTALVADGLAGAPQPAALVPLAATALALDAVDGKVARRTGTVSAFGARFDMETDAFLILVLSLHVSSPLGGWVLAIGAMRYAFGAAAVVLPWLAGDLPPRHSRKVVAATQGVVLVVVSAGALPQTWSSAAVAAALAALLWSFGRDVGWLRQTRA